MTIKCQFCSKMVFFIEPYMIKKKKNFRLKKNILIKLTLKVIFSTKPTDVKNLIHFLKS